MGMGVSSPMVVVSAVGSSSTTTTSSGNKLDLMTISNSKLLICPTFACRNSPTRQFCFRPAEPTTHSSSSETAMVPSDRSTRERLSSHPTTKLVTTSPLITTVPPPGTREKPGCSMMLTVPLVTTALWSLTNGKQTDTTALAKEGDFTNTKAMLLLTSILYSKSLMCSNKD